jgi:hypothetical protein
MRVIQIFLTLGKKRGAGVAPFKESNPERHYPRGLRTEEEKTMCARILLNP